jgi:1-acyl-sn-glycerol-3-phosphate acyltransferase
MIEAKKSRFFNAWFAGHARKRIRRSFSAVYTHGLDAVMEAAAEHPLVVVSNHTSWWDGLVAIHLANHVLGVDGYAMMDEANLRRLPFFRKVGAFGVDLETPGAARESIAYAQRLLERPGRLVWIYAQGRERPVTERPLGFRRGSAVVAAAVPEAWVVPVAVRYELGHLEQPFLYLSFGEPRPALPEIEAERARQEQAATRELDRIDAHIREQGTRGIAPFTPLMPHRPRFLARFAEWWLAHLTGRRRFRRRRPASLPTRPDNALSER